MLYIAVNLKRHGYSVEAYDFNIYTDSELDEIKHRILQKNPEIVGLSVSTPNYNYAVSYAKKIKEHLGNDCKIVFGGYHVSFLSDECLDTRALQISLF